MVSNIIAYSLLLKKEKKNEETTASDCRQSLTKHEIGFGKCKIKNKINNFYLKTLLTYQ